MRASIAPTLAAVRVVGREVVVAGQPVDHRGRLALQHVQDRAARIGLRLGHRNAVPRQVLHQVQVERQLPSVRRSNSVRTQAPPVVSAK